MSHKCVIVLNMTDFIQNIKHLDLTLANRSNPLAQRIQLIKYLQSYRNHLVRSFNLSVTLGAC